MSELMNSIMMALTAIVSLIAISVAMQNNRAADRIEDTQSRMIETITANKNELNNRVDNVIRAENTWHDHIEDEIKNITDKMAAYAKDFGRLDEIDFRSRRAQATASDAARCVVLNHTGVCGDVPVGTGVNWASQFPDQEGDHE